MSDEVVGLVPAAGRALRLAPLPCSKELLPVGSRPGPDGQPRPRPVCTHLLERFRQAGVRRAFIVLREGKWDIPNYLRGGSAEGLDLAYVVTEVEHGPPFTLDAAYPFVEGHTVAFGFPDIVFEPSDVFVQLLQRLRETSADAVLGLFPAHDPPRLDMVAADGDGRVRELVIQPEGTELRDTWICAVWEPSFSRFMHERLPALEEPARRELSVGHVFREALARGVSVHGVRFERGRYLDIGTPRGLANAAAWEH